MLQSIVPAINLKNRRKNHSSGFLHSLHLTSLTFVYFYIITQVILAFRLVLTYDLLEDRCTIDVIITKFFPLCFKMAESFENLDNILHDWAKDKHKAILMWSAVERDCQTQNWSW